MKAYFLYPAAVVGGILLAGSLVAAAMDDNERMAWLGAAMANLPLPYFVSRLLLKPVPRTSENLPLLLFLAAAGLLLAAWQTYMDNNASWPPSAVALAGSLLLLLYVFWYSRFGRFADPQLAVGGKLPDFELATLDGSTIHSADFRGKPTICIFYRGNWCPVCVAQVREIAARHGELERLGVRLALVSSQPVEETRRLAASTGSPAPFLLDRGNSAARQLGIPEADAVPFGRARGFDPESAMPTIILTNGNGTILYADQTDNYRVRPEPDIYISILKRTGVLAS